MPYTDKPQFKYTKGVDLILSDPDATELLSANDNPLVVDYLLQHPELISFNYLPENKHPRMVDYMLRHPEYISWFAASRNPSPRIVEYLIQHPEVIDWKGFARNENPQAVEFQLQHPEKIYWNGFTQNTCPQAVEYLIRNPARISWYNFACNQNSRLFEYVMQNPDNLDLHDKIDLRELVMTPNLFELDFRQMSSARTRHFMADLGAATSVPKRVSLRLTNHLDSNIGKQDLTGDDLPL